MNDIFKKNIYVHFYEMTRNEHADYYFYIERFQLHLLEFNQTQINARDFK
jgi:hypothetical protein